MAKKIVIAPDSFKESMTAKQAAEAIERGFRSGFPGELEVDLIPMADGGEGTTQSLTDALDGEIFVETVTGPMGEPAQASYAVSGDNTTAILEMAESSGLALIPKEKRNPLLATTYGTGELIKKALGHGVSKIILGIGGSATNDGGAGMIEALGGELFYDSAANVQQGGGALIYLNEVDLAGLDPRLAGVEIEVACDVDNPLLGPNGASAIYGPQKGATEEMVQQLDDALAQYDHVLARATGQDVKETPGAGAAGGLGAGLLALGAKLRPGVEIVLKETNFPARVAGADLVITGEGKIDGQTIYGKTPIGVAKSAREHSGAKVIGMCGALGNGYEKVIGHGIDAVFSISRGPGSLEEALSHGPASLEAAAENVARVWGIGWGQ